MRRTLPCLLLVTTATAATGAHAGDGWEPLDRIRDAATSAIARQMPSTARVSAVPLDQRLRLPACEHGLAAQAPLGTRGGTAFNVPVQCDAPVAWTVHVSVRVADIRPVVVLARGVGRGEVISTDMLTLQDRDVGALPLGFLSDTAGAVGQTLKRPMSAGAVVTPDTLEAPRLIRRGELVTLVGRAGPVEVRTQGKALSDGADGERIAVQNSASRRIIQGVVTGPGQVEVPL